MLCKSKMLTFFFITLYFVILTEAEVWYKCPKNVVKMEDEKTAIMNLEEYCRDQPCIPKCCKLHEILVERNGTHWPKCGDPKIFNITVDYNSKMPIYESNVEENVNNNIEAIRSKKNFFDFQLVHNKVFEKDTCAKKWLDYKTYILESGSMTTDLTKYGIGWIRREPAHYCTDLLFNEEGNSTRVAFFLGREKEKDYSVLKPFSRIASLISAFFLALVFLVYCVLPQLRGISGMLLMAYVAALCLSFIMKVHFSFAKWSVLSCYFISSLFYFGFLSSFFWLNIMSFDIWWTFRAQRYQRAIHRQGILAKFGWYSLYGWGVPLAMTISGIIIDVEAEKLPSTFMKPSFKNCLNGDSLKYYLLTPIGILTMINIILFLMTVYNIWLINREITKFSGSSNTKNNNRFRTYAKLSLLMGTSWLLEFIPQLYDDRVVPDWLNILIPFYNFMIGLVIFIMFICNKKTLRMLCKRFNIKCRFTQELNLNQSSRSTATKSSTHTGSYHRSKSTTVSDIEMEETEVNTDPRYKK